MSKMNLRVRRELTRLKKEEGAHVPNEALRIAEHFGMVLRRVSATTTDAAELCIDLALAAKAAR
jgi:hypothetical protein